MGSGGGRGNGGLKQLTSVRSLVLYYGDGAVTNSTNLHGVSIWIDVPLELAANDLKNIGAHTISDPDTEYEHVFGPGNDKYNVYFAAHKTNVGSYFGLVLTMDVYGYDLTNGQLSTTTITIANMEGDPKSDEDALWVGWQVFPEHYGDSRTRFFTLWTRDTYRSTGCFDMECPGFEPASGSGIAPGAIIEPVSDITGARRQNLIIQRP